MPTSPDAIIAAITDATATGFRGRLIARGQARAMIWRDGVLPPDAPAFTPQLSFDLQSYAYGLLGLGLRLLELDGDPNQARIAFEQAATALEYFRGAGRRFELRATVAGKRVYDDYAHHPTEVEAALKQARIVAGDGRVVAVFQPHLYSRTRNFADRFASALSHADEVVLADIYAAREDPIPGVTTELILDSPKLTAPARYIGDCHDAAVVAAGITNPGDVCLLIGAGDIFLQSSTVERAWTEEATK